MSVSEKTKRWAFRLFRGQDNAQDVGTHGISYSYNEDEENLRLGDDPDKWSGELEEHLRKTAPAAFRMAQRSGQLPEHMQTVVDWGRKKWHALKGATVKELNNQRAKVKLDLVERALQFPALSQDLENELRGNNVLGDDPGRWISELEEYLKTSGPMGYAEAQRLRRVDFHLQKTVTWAKEQWSRIDNIPDSALQQQKRSELKGQLITRAWQIEPSPREILDRISGGHCLKIDEMQQLVELYRLAEDEEEQSKFLCRIVDSLQPNSHAGRLLSHGYFEECFGQEEVYLYALATVHFAQGEISKAAEVFERCLELKKRPATFLRLASCYHSLRQNDKTLACLKKARELYPDDAYVWAASAGASFGTGDLDNANKYLSKVRDEYLSYFEGYVEKIRNAEPELQTAMRKKLVYKIADADVYDEDYTRYTWNLYWYHMNAYTRYEHDEGILGELTPELIAVTINNSQTDIDKVIDFGCMCGQTLYRTALSFPNIKCVGIDRNPLVKELNDKTYSLPNLSFAHGDVIEFVERTVRDDEAVVLHHSRTAPFLYPEFLRKFYSVCHRAGVRYVSLLEAYNFSMRTGKYETFDEMEPDSEVRGGGYFHHNYPRLLRESGYEVISQTHPPIPSLSIGVDQPVHIIAEHR